MNRFGIFYCLSIHRPALITNGWPHDMTKRVCLWVGECFVWAATKTTRLARSRSSSQSQTQSVTRPESGHDHLDGHRESSVDRRAGVVHLMTRLDCGFCGCEKWWVPFGWWFDCQCAPGNRVFWWDKSRVVDFLFVSSPLTTDESGRANGCSLVITLAPAVIGATCGFFDYQKNIKCGWRTTGNLNSSNFCL